MPERTVGCGAGPGADRVVVINQAAWRRTSSFRPRRSACSPIAPSRSPATVNGNERPARNSPSDKLDGRLVDSETTSIWAGPYVLVVATALPEPGLAVEVHSTFVGHRGVPTSATHLTLGPVGFSALMITREHEHANLNPATSPRQCVYEHARIVIEILQGLD
jgi:hypothetical protein